MQTLQGIFIKRYDPVSLGIRAVLPRSIIMPARSSHVITVDGDHAIEAKMVYFEDGKLRSGVRRVPLEQALHGAQIVTQVQYRVPDAAAGLAFARAQVGKTYDFKGAAGLAVSPARGWQEDDAWFCYELHAATLHAAGRLAFASTGHITERELLGIAP